MDIGDIKYLTKTNETADILRRAKASIDSPDKWWGCAEDALPGRRCALVAIADAARTSIHPAFQVFGAAIGSTGAGVVCSIPRWNDSHTHAEVMDAFSRAIELAERS